MLSLNEISGWAKRSFISRNTEVFAVALVWTCLSNHICRHVSWICLPSKTNKKIRDWGHYTAISVLCSNFSLNQNCFFAAYDDRPSTKSLAFRKRWYVSHQFLLTFFPPKRCFLFWFYICNIKISFQKRKKKLPPVAQPHCVIFCFHCYLICFAFVFTIKKCHGSWLLQILPSYCFSC